MAANHTCLCEKTFRGKRAIHAHQAVCSVYKAQPSRIAPSKRRRTARSLSSRGSASDSDDPAPPKRSRRAASVEAIEDEQDSARGSPGNEDLGPLPADGEVAIEEIVSDEEPEPIRSARSGRPIHVPKRFADFGLDHDSKVPIRQLGPTQRERQENDARRLAEEEEEDEPTPSEPSIPEDDERFKTKASIHGLYRVYRRQPTHDPLEREGVAARCDAAMLADSNDVPDPAADFGPGRPDPIDEATGQPFSSSTAATFMSWALTGNDRKNGPEIERLTKKLSEHLRQQEGMTIEDLCDILEGFSYRREQNKLDDYLEGFKEADGWVSGEVSIPMPRTGQGYTSEADAPRFVIKDIRYRKLTSIIEGCYSSAKPGNTIHTDSYELYWERPAAQRRERIYSEVYDTSAMPEAEAEVQGLDLDVPPEEDYERVVVPMLPASDATHLASFGNASLLPFYLQLGGQSKYARGRPSARACHHVCYSPTLGSDFEAAYVDAYGSPPSEHVLRFCKRELVHAVWSLICDEDFRQAFEHGLVVKCSDGRLRRLFPRWFTYSADYPEKVLIACIKYLGNYPCPVCLVRHDKIDLVGTVNDLKFRRNPKNARVETEHLERCLEKARKLIFERGRAVNSKAVDRVLGSKGRLPHRNAFLQFFKGLKAELSSMFAPDLLHEFELSIWKGIFIHLLRLLQALEGDDAIHKLNERYRKVPTFGQSTIRRVSNAVSELKKLAARDFEDFLQCSIPAFDGLFEAKFDGLVRSLLFDLATWHGLAKLRLHTDSTLVDFEQACTTLGTTVRRWIREMCNPTQTKELPKESRARVRRQAKRVAEGASTAPVEGQKKKGFNWSTYKTHRLADYPDAIRRFGTTESFSTWRTELEHRLSKRRYARTNKNATFVNQLIRQEGRSRYAAANLGEQDEDRQCKLAQQQHRDQLLDDDGGLPPLDLKEHYQIGTTRSQHVDVTQFLAKYAADPGLKSFHARLMDFVRAQLLSDANGTRYGTAERRDVLIKNNQLFRHSTMQVNYTTYDVRVAQDTISPLHHPDCMFLADIADDDGERGSAGSFDPYLYGRVVYIFHTFAALNDPDIRPEYTRIDMCYVRWFSPDSGKPFGWAAKRLPRIGFPDRDDEDAFAFVHLNTIVRGSHLIPAFKLGRTTDGEWECDPLGPSTTRDTQSDRDERDNGDYMRYYVNMFVDRDMVMRYRGGGVGHLLTREHDARLSADRALEGDDGDVVEHGGFDDNVDGGSDEEQDDVAEDDIGWEEDEEEGSDDEGFGNGDDRVADGEEDGDLLSDLEGLDEGEMSGEDDFDDVDSDYAGFELL